ncbi:hypothetical protein HDU84_009099, partial [Entophlyctis sp. JEL0112]
MLWTLSSYVSARLETISESVCEVRAILTAETRIGIDNAGNSGMSSSVEKITEAILEDNQVCVTETDASGTHNSFEANFPLMDGNQLLLFEGAGLVLNRLIAQTRFVGEIRARKYFSQKIYATTYTATIENSDQSCQTEIKKESDSSDTSDEIVHIVMLAKMSDDSMKEELSVSEKTHATGLVSFNDDIDISSIVKQAFSIDDEAVSTKLSEHAQPDEWFQCEWKMSAAGTCIWMQGKNGYYSTEWLVSTKLGQSTLNLTGSETHQTIAGKPHMHTHARSDAFSGDMELFSEYKQRKAELKMEHTEYIRQHPEMREMMRDYLQMVLMQRPVDVYAFTRLWLTAPHVRVQGEFPKLPYTSPSPCLPILAQTSEPNPATIIESITMPSYSVLRACEYRQKLHELDVLGENIVDGVSQFRKKIQKQVCIEDAIHHTQLVKVLILLRSMCMSFVNPHTKMNQALICIFAILDAVTWDFAQLAVSLPDGSICVADPTVPAVDIKSAAYIPPAQNISAEKTTVSTSNKLCVTSVQSGLVSSLCSSAVYESTRFLALGATTADT